MKKITFCGRSTRSGGSGAETRVLRRVETASDGAWRFLLDGGEAVEARQQFPEVEPAHDPIGPFSAKDVDQLGHIEGTIGVLILSDGRSAFLNEWFRTTWGPAAESEPETRRARPSGKRDYRPASDSVQREFGKLYCAHRADLGKPPRALDFLAANKDRLHGMGIETVADVLRVREQCRKNRHISPWNTKRRKVSGK